MNTATLKITKCDDCPHFDNTWGFKERCWELERRIPSVDEGKFGCQHDRQHLDPHPIPDDCPKLTVIYNPDYGDNRMCKCGHPYGHHWDSSEGYIFGCEYCDCDKFVEDVSETIT